MGARTKGDFPRKPALALSLALIACSRPAFAQDAAESVLDSFAELDPSGDYFIDLDRAAAGPQPAPTRPLQASFDAAAVGNSNLFVTPDDTTAAIGIDLSPRATLSREGPRLKLDGSIGGHARLYADHSTENLYEVDSDFDIRWLASRDLSLFASASAGRFVEDRAAAFASVDLRKPVPYERFQGIGGFRYAPGRLVLVTSAGVDRFAYHDVATRADPSTISDQSRRSLTRFNPSVIAGYQVPGGALFYAGLEGDWRDYDENPARNSDGFAVYGGVRVRPNRLFGATVELGYQEQNYDPPLASPSGLLARAELEYVPNPLTRISASFRRDISETGALELGGATRNTVQLAFDRTISRAWAVTAELRATRSEASGGTVRQDRLTALLETRYIVAPRQELFVRVEPLISGSSGSLATAPDFERILALAGLRLQFN